MKLPTDIVMAYKRDIELIDVASAEQMWIEPR
jgi:hypothetical protein